MANNYYNDHTVIYHNGHFVKARDARIDLYSQTMHYGYGVFEGIRSYRLASGETGIFKARQHFDRLQQSAAALHLPYTYTTPQLIEATYKVLSINHLQNAYIRPLVYAPANMTFAPNTHSHIVIEAWEMQPFLGEQLLRVMTSSYQRLNPKGFHMHAKVCGHYVNSILASQEAKRNGYDEALMTDNEGNAAEAPGANLFYEKDGILYTPELGNILPGITRATVLEICEALGIEVLTKKISVEELKQADTAFFCGTAAEIIGIKSIDDTIFPAAWESTLSKRIQYAYKCLIAGLPIAETETLVA
jgi:branched-chain amino acid aminotransferase